MLEGAERAATRAASECPLRHQRRDSQGQNGDDVDRHERRPAIPSDHVREAPAIPETDCDADHRDQQAEARREAPPEPGRNRSPAR